MVSENKALADLASKSYMRNKRQYSGLLKEVAESNLLGYWGPEGIIISMKICVRK
jgi:hypothetical protein